MESWQQWEGRVVNGRYPLGQYLGGTERRAVYLTNDKGSKAAIKLIAADASDSPQQLSRWELAAKLSHPHLLPILDVGRWHADDRQDMLFAVIEYADENLSESRRALTADETRQMLEPVLDALRYLHAQGLVHSRLRPANVMAVGEVLKLSCDGVRRMGKLEAAPIKADVYDAPERANGVLAPSGDIWSLGVILVHVLTYGVRESSAECNPKASESLPSPFDQIVQHCLSRDPEQRWSASEIKKHIEGAEIDTQAKSAELSKEPHQHGMKDTGARLVAASPPTVKSPSSSLVNNESPRFRSLSTARQRLILSALIAVVLITLIVGLQWSRNHSESNQSATTISNQSAASTTALGNGAGAETPTTAPAARSGTRSGQAAVLHQVLPEVSRRARDSISGTVKVKVNVAVDASGTVSRTVLVAHGPSAYFAKQAMQAARQWSFRPPDVHGQPGTAEWALTFEFRKSGTKTAARRLS